MALDTQELHAALARIRLLVLDVDGVMTDGGIILGTSEELKRYDSRDGVGIKYLLRNGIQVAVITGRDSMSVSHRCKELGIHEIHQHQVKKLPCYQMVLTRLGLKNEEAAVIGDDLADLPVMIKAGIGIAVGDATEEVKRRAGWVTQASGGHGAIREVAEAILKAKGLWEKLVEHYVS